ncbi:hypothetical protein EMIHUDRAFT_98168 [Emiliania huxleyi CCMP1516]|uniref:ethanolamine-phosphate cytidylyltransferase n=2 Tax=Emiliania huxleyi TaxID=2903 RepID=A0A0D3KLV5_EMIH1|nr:hypothetical protein EMIHUDRAFT_98168 [Emiliania huxleyi CCMP1516]EOD36740.1 hypothetical protein EMIHUDRAFT_98168 [Emiliania huxleyi CCMP1516]|eukprot:XP_005789169.1 hypothetical protein EMIHUDRAFT_98168 [Emiliania huxleyi CCMP1516]
MPPSWLSSFAPAAAGFVLGVLALTAHSHAQRRRPRRRRRVFVSGCFDLLHSGHVAFFEEARSTRTAAALGELHVSVGNDANVTALKAAPMFPEAERVYMVGAIRWVSHAFVARGMGHDQGRPGIAAVRLGGRGDQPSKRQQCAERGIEYVVAKRAPQAGLHARSSTSIKASLAAAKKKG